VLRAVPEIPSQVFADFFAALLAACRAAACAACFSAREGLWVLPAVAFLASLGSLFVCVRSSYLDGLRQRGIGAQSARLPAMRQQIVDAAGRMRGQPVHDVLDVNLRGRTLVSRQVIAVSYGKGSRIGIRIRPTAAEAQADSAQPLLGFVGDSLDRGIADQVDHDLRIEEADHHPTARLLAYDHIAR
jgi:hypothetical protein